MNRFLMMTLVFLGLICPNAVLSADDAFMSRRMVYVSSRGLPQHPSGTVWGLVNRCLSPKATKSWEILSDNARILHIVADDPMTRQTLHTKILFEVLGGNTGNIFVSRVVINGEELVGGNRDATFGALIMNCLHEDKTGTALPMYGDAAPKRQEPEPDEYDDYTPEIPFGEGGMFCGFVSEHRVLPQKSIGQVVLHNMDKSRNITILYDAKDEESDCRSIIKFHEGRGSMMCIDAKERPNDLGLEQIGIKGKSVLWGESCSTPG